jgi:hypothetical protein
MKINSGNLKRAKMALGNNIPVIVTTLGNRVRYFLKT